jgi:hypothetical protein
MKPRIYWSPDAPAGVAAKPPAAPPAAAPPAATPAAAAAKPPVGAPPAAVPPAAAPAKPTEVPKPAGPDPADLSLRLQALDREKWRVEQQVKAAEAELTKLRAEQEAWKRDPYATAEKLGVTLEGFTERQARGGRPGPDQHVLQLQQQVQNLTETIQQLQQGFQGQHKAQTLRGYADEARRTLAATPDMADASLALEIADVISGGTTDLTGQIDALIESERQATGRDLTASQATAILGRELTTSLTRLRQNPRARELFGKLFGFEVSAATPPPAAGDPAQPPGATLTHRDESGSEPVDLDKIPRDSKKWWEAAARKVGVNPATQTPAK